MNKYTTVYVKYNGKGFGAYYIHIGSQVAAFDYNSAGLDHKLKRFIERCRHFGVPVRVIRQPSFFAALAAEKGSEKAARLLAQAAKNEGPWQVKDLWDHYKEDGEAYWDEEERWEDKFREVGGWRKVVETYPPQKKRDAVCRKPN